MAHKRSGWQPAPFVGSDLSAEDFDRIRALLYERRNFDLGMYKDQCVRRRIATRVRACDCERAEDYIALLERREDEIDALLGAISIHVSQFFRNPQMFIRLERNLLPGLIDRAMKRPERRLSIWSAGCSTGEEVYSLALLVDELAPAGLELDILGTDISRQALDRAREGLFDQHRLREVPEAVLERYFEPEGFRYRICERLRRQVRFEWHDLLQPAPYPRVDLVLCRNVMIYFSRADQGRILERMARALSPEGFLVLGSAETIIGEPRRWFEPLIAGERIYRCLQAP
ncbi:MAG: protein-glutamate O-methyltransferase CheR [Geothermobacteraceae bacterium]